MHLIHIVAYYSTCNNNMQFLCTINAHTLYPDPIANRGGGHLIKYSGGNES